MSVVAATNYTLPGLHEDGGLDIALTRYRLTEPAGPELGGARLSLLFLHGVSYHKEIWLPTIEHLYEMQLSVPNNKFAILEAWVMDAPNHGRAAILNDARLLSHSQSISPPMNARAVQVVLTSGLLQGSSVVGVAHSGFTAVLSLSTAGYHVDRLPFSCMILVDPAIMTREVYERVGKRGSPWEFLAKSAKERKNIWRSREDARAWLAKRPPWNTWTPRCLDLFVEYALCNLPTATYPDRTDGVTLCCTREQEAGEYVYSEYLFEALDRFEDICTAIPVHTIFGGREDLVPQFIKPAFVGAKQCRNMAAVTTIPNAGHLVHAEDPKSVALAIWGALHESYQRRRGDTSRL